MIRDHKGYLLWLKDKNFSDTNRHRPTGGFVPNMAQVINYS